MATESDKLRRETESAEADKKNKMDRRRFAQIFATASCVSVFGAAGSASGKKPGNGVNSGKVTGREVKEIINKEKSRILLNELGNPPLQRGRAKRTSTSVGSSKLDAVAVPSQLGQFVYSESDNGIAQAFFFFGPLPDDDGGNKKDEIPPGFIKKLPKEYRDPARREGVVIVGYSNEPVLINGQSSNQEPEVETLVNSKQVRIAKVTYGGETSLVKEYKRGPKAGVVEYAPPEKLDGVIIKESEDNDVRTQAASTEVVSAMDVDVTEAIERSENFFREIGPCEVFSQYNQHKYEGVAFELTKAGESYGTNGLTAILSVVGGGIGTYFGPGIGTLVGGVVGFVAGVILDLFVQTKNFTIGRREFDAQILAGSIAQVGPVVEAGYLTPASEAAYRGSVFGHPNRDPPA